MASKSTEATTLPKKKSSAELLREKKITAYLEQISQNEESISLMNAERSALSQANIIGLPVLHKLFGEGTVSKQDDLTVTVQFAQDSKRFSIPGAFFEGFLRTDDAEMNQRLTRYQEITSGIAEIRRSISASDHAIQALKK